MRIAYFDCFSGISGDMVLGALIDVGAEFSELERGVAKLSLSGHEIQIEKAAQNEIWGTKVKIKCKEGKVTRKLTDIFSIIDNSGLDEDVKLKSKKIFNRLAKAEAKVHNKPVSELHFHEVGAIDAIIDIVGSVICVKNLGIEEIYSSPLHVGTGFVECTHGILPVPAPATIELTKNIPVYSTGIKSELVTPTGAAIITTMATKFGDLPHIKIEKIGYGVGSKKLKIPNLLRVLIGEMIHKPEEDRVIVIETNIDDMNPQFYDYVVGELLKEGAKDVYFTPTYMKKNRPGIILSVISPVDKVDDLTEVIFKHTTSLGARISEVKNRKKLRREIKKISTRFGEIRVKIGFLGSEPISILPEYEDCKMVAKKMNVPIKNVYNEVISEIQKTL